MDMQDQPIEDVPLLPATDQEIFVHAQTPHTPVPAASEQFAFPEDLSMPQDFTDLLTNEAGSVANAPLPDQPLVAEQAPLVEYGVYPSASTPPSPVQTAVPSPLPPRKRRKATILAVLSLVIVLILLSSAGLLYDLNYYQPLQAHLAATAQANAQVTSTFSAANTMVANLSTSVAVQGQATAEAEQELYQQSTSGTPILNDELNQQTSNQWDEGTFPDHSSCLFKGGSYHVLAPNQGFYESCNENTKGFADFAFQVDMTIINGDRGGILFRSNSGNGQTYLWDMNARGAYDLYVYSGFAASQSQTLLNGAIDFMLAGVNQITVIALGNTLSFYLNQQFIASIADPTLKAGQVGVLADDYQQPTEVTFNNAKVWVL